MGKPLHRCPVKYQLLLVEGVLLKEQRIFNEEHNVYPSRGRMRVE
jgi:hypothetical protein